jgi:hypothetical protein
LRLDGVEEKQGIAVLGDFHRDTLLGALQEHRFRGEGRLGGGEMGPPEVHGGEESGRRSQRVGPKVDC